MSFLLSTSGEPRDDQTTGPVVSARFRIQTEALTLPTLRLVDPRLRLTAEARTVVARWEASAPGPYALGFTGPGRALVWEASAADPAATVDARVLEDVTGLATVAGVRTDQATGSDVTIHWRSPGLAYRGGFGAPPSRGAACEARAADGLAQALDGCPLTDGSFDVAGVLGSVCAGPATSAGASTQPPACAPVERVRFQLARPVAAELLVVRGCSEPCRADTVVADGGTAIDVGPVSGPFATVALGGTRVTAVDIVTTDPTSLAEVSVWGPVAEGPALRPVADPEALAPTTGDDEEDRRVPAAFGHRGAPRRPRPAVPAAARPRQGRRAEGLPAAGRLRGQHLEGLEELHRDREHDRGAVLGGDLHHGLQLPELQGAGRGAEHGGRLAQLLRACSSPSAAMIFARRSRSASACRAMARCSCSGTCTSRISTRCTLMPHDSVCASSASCSSASMRSRSVRSWSSSCRPTIERRVVWATSCDELYQSRILMTDASGSTTWK